MRYAPGAYCSLSNLPQGEPLKKPLRLTIPLLLLCAMVLSSCAAFEAFGDELTRAFKGVPATMTTYTQSGQMVDQVHGESFRISRDERFDSEASDGSSNKDSSVLLISLGDNHISHVGSSMVLAQDGLVDISKEFGDQVSFENHDPGMPWLNDLKEYMRNNWKGKGKTILIRSQDGTPIAVYQGDQVEIRETDVPKSTWFEVDHKYLFVYRSDYTVYDNELLS